MPHELSCPMHLLPCVSRALCASWSTCSRALYISYPTCSLLHVPRALCALVPNMPCAVVHAIAPNVPQAPRALIPSVPWILRPVVSHVSHVVHALVPHVHRLPPHLVSHMSCSYVPSFFIRPYTIVPRNLSTACAKITFSALEFPCLMLLFSAHFLLLIFFEQINIVCKYSNTLNWQSALSSSMIWLKNSKLSIINIKI